MPLIVPSSIASALAPRPPTLRLPPVVLLDLDDTIVRFSSGQPDPWRAALQPYTPAEQWAGHLDALRRTGHEYWKNAQRAYWGRQNLLKARAVIARDALIPRGVPAGTAEAIGQHMTHFKEAAMRPFHQARDTLHRLRAAGHRLGLLTNGCSEFQRRKIARFALEGFFELILIEGELGFGKPDPRVFDRALQHFAVPPSQAVMIGDNLEADIAGAAQQGIRTIWNNCNALPLPGGAVAPDHQVSSLAGLFDVLPEPG